jgi:hypothetical protein
VGHVSKFKDGDARSLFVQADWSIGWNTKYTVRMHVELAAFGLRVVVVVVFLQALHLLSN